MAVYHRTKRLKIYGKKPEVTQLFGGRYAITVRCQAKNDTEAWYDKNKDQIFADFGTLYDAHMAVDGIDARTGETYPDMVLTRVRASYTQTGEYVITFQYQTLTSSFVQEAADKVDQELNGLRRVTRRLIAKDGSTYGKSVGSDTISHSAIGYSTATLTLAEAVSGEKDPDESGFVRIEETWMQSGVLSRTINESNGGTGTGKIRTEVVEAFNEAPTSTISGVEIGVTTSNVQGIDTIRKTFVSSSGEIRRTDRPGPDAIPGTTFVTIDSVGAAVTPSGTLIDSSETQENGYVRFSRTALQGTIIKTTQTYKDVVFVDVPGEVSCETIDADFDGIADIIDGQKPVGQSVVIETIPPKKQQLEADVVVSIQSSIPDTTELAFDISGLSCSVLRTTSSNSGQVGRAVTLVDSSGSTSTQVGSGSSFSVNSNISEFPRHFVVDGGTQSLARLSGSRSRQPYISGGSFQFQSAQSGSFTQAFAFGNDENDKNELYKTSGVISRRFRPVLTAQDGSVFYEVTTVSASATNPITGLPIGRPLK
tara:strand:- start:7327 stop:8937 length:1611 start_codon:yes stop_codon:yes gene_type:complete